MPVMDGYQSLVGIRNLEKERNIRNYALCILGLNTALRKTFGYHAWQQGTPPALLMNLYNHSSYQITKRYLGIGQDERDQVYLQINL